MKLDLTVANPDKHTSACLIIPVLEAKELSGVAQTIDKASKKTLSNLIKNGTFEAKRGNTLWLFQPGGAKYDQILLVGMGKAKDLSANRYKKVAKAAFKKAIASKAKNLVSYLSDIQPEKRSEAWAVKQVAESFWDAMYRFDIFKSESADEAVCESLILNISSTKAEKACRTALIQGECTASGAILAKNLANLPSNVCTPEFLAEQAEELAKELPSLEVDILEEDDMVKLGMGALLAVSQGSAEDAKLICIEYKGGKKSDKPYVFVGKGITFDTGGNSIKPADSMVGMKYDMCGAASVFGLMKAVAELELPLNVVGIVPAVENMPGGAAYKPEDILKSMSGTTIEVISTDAEGRLILADALTYAEKYEPQAVVDIATLTGAVVIALGFHATGVMTNHEPLSKALLDAGIESADRGWPLPMWEEYQEQIKSPYADISNVGGRPAGSITAGCFLSRFAKKFKWAHLDVAGTAAMMMGGNDRYATGRPVPMLVQYLIDQAG